MQMILSRTYLLFILAGLQVISACNKSQQPGSPQNSSTKHYQLKGKVVSIDQQSKAVNVDSEAIPGFMDAMTMPYQVKPESELGKLQPGDEITADLIVEDTNAWLENITITGHAPRHSMR
jgi:protein SCO1/2